MDFDRCKSLPFKFSEMSDLEKLTESEQEVKKHEFFVGMSKVYRSHELHDIGFYVVADHPNEAAEMAKLGNPEYIITRLTQIR